MKKTVIGIIVVIVVLLAIALILIFIIAPRDSDEYKKRSCDLNSGCVSQCSRGCVNANWALSNPDTSECFRAWDCSCVNNRCYTDGKPRI
jgi:hypothetical protein